MTLENILRNSSLFHNLSDLDLQHLVPICKRVDIEEGTDILREGEPVSHIHIVEEGRVALKMALERPDGSSTGPTTVASIGPEEAFGWSALVEPYLSTLTVSAVDPSKLVSMDGASLRAALDHHKDIGYLVMGNLTRLIAERLAETREALVYHRTWVECVEREEGRLASWIPSPSAKED